jgi:hypothetical protein
MFFKIASKNLVHDFVKSGTSKYRALDLSLAASQLTSVVISTALVLAPFAYPQMAEANPNDLVWQQIARTQALPDASESVDLSPVDLAEVAVNALQSMLVDYNNTFVTLDDLATQFGNDPEAAFNFVRDRIRTEPYVGTLRNPASVIAASGGNSQDKSELLLVLLRKMGLDARIAEAPLTAVIAARLNGSNCQIALPVDAHIGQLIGLSDPATSRAIVRAQRDYARLRDAVPALTDAKLALSTAFGERHYWVQYRDANGWRDVDPTVPDMQAGEAMAEAVALSEGGIDPHLVTIAVTVETLRDGKLREQSILSQDFIARDSDETMIQLAFTPATPGTGGILNDAFGDTLNVTPKLKPVLVVDFVPTLGGAFAQPGPAASGGLSDTSQDDPVTAVWLDITSISPQGINRKARRALIDILPFTARQSGDISADAILTPVAGLRHPQDLEGLTQILITNGGLDGRNDAYRAAYIFKSWNETLAAVIDGTIAPEILGWISWTTAHGLATGAERATRDLQTEDGKTCGFYGHANVMLSTIYSTNDDTIESSIDWAIDGIDVTSAIPDPDPTDVQAMRLWYGAVRSAIETEVVSAGIEGGHVVSTSVLLDGPLAPLSAERAAEMESLMVQRDVENGYLIMSGQSGDASAWWRVDPITGATDARMAELGNIGFTWGGNGVNAIKFAGEYYMSSKQYDLQVAFLRRQITDRQFSKAMKALNYYKNLEAKRAQKANEYLMVQQIGIAIATAVGVGVGLTLYIKYADAWGYRHPTPTK